MIVVLSITHIFCCSRCTLYSIHSASLLLISIRKKEMKQQHGHDVKMNKKRSKAAQKQKSFVQTNQYAL